MADEKTSSYSYIGWIPNTTGHVYFRNAKVRQGISDIYSINYDEKKSGVRYILGTSLVDNNDQKPTDEETTFSRHVIIGKSIDKGALIGKVYMSFANKICTNSKQVSLIKKIETAGKTAFRLKTSAGDFEPVYSDFTDELENLESDFSCYDFVISTHGMCYLVWKSGLNADELAQAVYFYLKYLMHTHTHHDNELDTFCGLHAIPNDGTDVTKGNLLAKKFMSDIKSNLVAIKLNDALMPGCVRQAEGLAAYGNTLLHSFFTKGENIKGILEPILSDTDANKLFVQRQEKYLHNIVSSLRIKHEEHQAVTLFKVMGLSKFWYTYFLLLCAPITFLWYRANESSLTANEGVISCILRWFTQLSFDYQLLVYLFIPSVLTLFAWGFLWYRESGSIKSFLLTDTFRSMVEQGGLLIPKYITNKCFPSLRLFWLDKALSLDWSRYFGKTNIDSESEASKRIRNLRVKWVAVFFLMLVFFAFSLYFIYDTFLVDK